MVPHSKIITSFGAKNIYHANRYRGERGRGRLFNTSTNYTRLINYI